MRNTAATDPDNTEGRAPLMGAARPPACRMLVLANDLRLFKLNTRRTILGCASPLAHPLVLAGRRLQHDTQRPSISWRALSLYRG